MAAGVLPLAGASAATKTWNSTSSTDWLTAGNWTASGVPAAADAVVIDLGAYGPDVVTTGPTATYLYVGNGGTGTLSISNGGTVSDTDGFIGNIAGSTGTATVTGIGSNWTNSSGLRVGQSGTGTLNVQSGGTVSNANSYIGALAGSIGTATVTGSGSSWTNSSSLYVGYVGTGTLTISSGGTVTAGATSDVGSGAGSSGTATVTGSGSSLSVTGFLNVGQLGNGVMLVDNGGTVNSTDGNIGNISGSVSSATVDGSGSSWNTSNTLQVGREGTGTLTISNGGSVTAVLTTIGRRVGGNGTVIVTGSGSNLSNSGSLELARDSTGTLTIADGATVSAATGATMATNTGSVGTLNIGAATGAAVAPGTLSVSTVAIGAGTGVINFNHTSSDYTFAPVISGAGTINALAGTTTLIGDLSGFTGSTQLAGGTLFYGYGGSSSISTALSGTGGFVVASGGTTTLTGNSSGFAGTATVEDGSTLSLNGALGGALSVNSGGTLKGSGTAATVAAGTGGSIAPGNSIGTLTVTDISFAPGAVYEAEIDANGNHDLIHATGTATLTGGQVAVSYAPGNYLPGMSYTLLTADGGLTGTFDSQTDTLGTLFMEAELAYDPNHVTLNLIQFRDFSTIAATQNQIAAANAAQALATGNPVYNNLVVMQDANAARAAFDSLSGEVHASTQAALIGSVQPVNDLLLGRLETISQATDRTPPFQVAAATTDLRGMIPQRRYEGAWVQGFGGWSRFDSNANVAETHARNSGLLMGLDGDLNEDWQGGAAAGYSVTDVNDRGRSSSALARNYHAAAYAGMKPYANQPVLRVGGGFTWHDVESTRGVGFGGFSDTNSADYDAWTAQAFADLSRPFAIGKGGSLSPFGTLAYLHQSTNAFTESGGPSALHVDGSVTDLATTTFGLRGSQRLSFPHRDIKQAALTGSAGWRHLIGDDTPTRAVSFASGGSGFAVDGTPMARNAFVYDAGVTLQLDANASLNLRYGGELAPETQAQSLSGEFRWAF